MLRDRRPVPCRSSVHPRRARIELARTVLLGLLFLLGGRTTVSAQQTRQSPELAALSSVMAHRLIEMGDSARFDACQLYQELGRPENFSTRLDPLAQRVLSHPGEPCPTPEGSSARVELLSVSLGDSVGTLSLRVRQGEYRYTETYTLRHSSEGVPWRVHEVRLHGWVQFLLAPQRTRRSGSP